MRRELKDDDDVLSGNGREHQRLESHEERIESRQLLPERPQRLYEESHEERIERRGRLPPHGEEPPHLNLMRRELKDDAEAVGNYEDLTFGIS